MKLILKETVERYHVVDLDEGYDPDEFIEDLASLNPAQGMEVVEEMIEDICRQYGFNCKVEYDKAGMETTAFEVVDEYDE